MRVYQRGMTAGLIAFAVCLGGCGGDSIDRPVSDDLADDAADAGDGVGGYADDGIRAEGPGMIAFASERDGNWEIYLMDPDGGNQRNWLSLELVGSSSNRDGFGARIAVTTGDIEQTVELTSGGSFLSHGDGRAHFGLGFYATAERVEIHWPSGRVQRLADVAANQILVVAEPAP